MTAFQITLLVGLGVIGAGVLLLAWGAHVDARDFDERLAALEDEADARA